MRWLDYALGMLGFYTANVANSLETEIAFARYPARYRRHDSLIEHGVPASQPTLSRATMLERFGVPDDRRILSIWSAHGAEKPGRADRALAHVPSARLLIAGGGPRRSEYEALAACLNVADRLHLLGDVTRDDIVNLLAACDLFVFPSSGRPSALRPWKPPLPACRSWQPTSRFSGRCSRTEVEGPPCSSNRSIPMLGLERSHRTARPIPPDATASRKLSHNDTRSRAWLTPTWRFFGTGEPA